MIFLKNVDQENFREVIGLTVADGQKNFVASNVFSIAQSKIQPENIPLAIYNDDVLVGFAMYGLDPDDQEYWISRLMIDKQFQAKGFGRQAMTRLISLIREDTSHHVIYLSFEPDNERARKLYESLGFMPDGRMCDGEIVYRLKHPPE
jgi:diamine N-acetyltransferase